MKSSRPQRWEKLGLVYRASGEQDWAQSHALVPTSMTLDPERTRVYAAFLDRGKVGRIGWVDVEAGDPRHVLAVSARPALDIGIPGTFDESGVTPVCLVRDQGRIFLYYVGWQLGTKVRYYLLTGLAASDDGGDTFHRCSQVPVLDRTDGELFVRSAVHVLSDGGLWKMWYVAGDRWIEAGGKQLPSYNMRYLESAGKASWGRQGKVCLDLAGDDEFGLARPFVVKEGTLYRMWYSIRSISKAYRLGYAESADGLAWRRMDDQVGIDVSPTGWDSEMICYACRQETRYGTYLFYNGNNYGETGFGVAVERG